MEDKFFYEYSAKKPKKTALQLLQEQEAEEIRKQYLPENVEEKKRKQINRKIKGLSVFDTALHILLGVGILVGGIFFVVKLQLLVLGIIKIFIGVHFITFMYVVYKKIYQRRKLKYNKIDY